MEEIRPDGRVSKTTIRPHDHSWIGRAFGNKGVMEVTVLRHTGERRIYRRRDKKVEKNEM